MWGSSIVGFGSYHYTYGSGREMEWFLVGFAPRKQDLTLYIMAGFDRFPAILARLGKYKTGKSCLYIKKLADVDQAALEELVSGREPGVQLMSIESPGDLEAMREVGRITRTILDALEKHVRAGVTTADLDRIAAAILAERGARSAPALVYGFPGHALISVNDEIVHGVPGPRRLERGDLVKLDVTVEKDGYFADAARTVIVGRGTDTAQRLVACAQAAFRAALAVARAGTRVNEIGRAVDQEVRRHGFTVVTGPDGTRRRPNHS